MITCTCGFEIHLGTCHISLASELERADAEIVEERKRMATIRKEMKSLGIDGEPSRESLEFMIERRARIAQRLGINETQSKAQVERTSGLTLPDVEIPGPATRNGTYYRVSTTNFTDAVLANIPTQNIYRKGDFIGAISMRPSDIPNMPPLMQWSPLSIEHARHLVDDHVRLRRFAEKDGKDVAVDVPCGTDHAKLVLDAAQRCSSIRTIRSVVRSPVFLPDWTISPPGYSSCGIYYDEPDQLRGFTPRENRALILDMLGDFPFTDEASRQNVLGAILTCMCRPCIRGNVPMHLVMATRPRTGKTKLIERVIGYLILGHGMPAMQFSGSEEERDKRIMSALIRGKDIVHLDNLRAYMDSAALASLLTAEVYSGRILGASQDVDLPNTLILFASGNNIRATGEIVDRCVPIMLQPRDSRPDLRTDFKHDPIEPWMEANRKAILEAFAWEVLNWVANGRQPGTSRLGGFEDWCRIIGGIVGGEHLANRNAFRKRTDRSGVEMDEFIDAWWGRRNSQHMTSSEMLVLADEMNLFEDITSRQSTDRGRAAAFSRKVLVPHRDTPMSHGIIRAVEIHGLTRWRIEPQEVG